MTQFQGPDGQEDMPYLLTPGPVTTSRAVKFAMLADWGAGDAEFIALIKTLNKTVIKIAGGTDAFDCVIMPGSDAIGIEATLGTFTPAKRKKTLIVSNGSSGHLAMQIMQRIGRNHIVLDCDELKPLHPQDVAKALDEDRNITHVWVVQCETSTGIVNPITEIAREVKARDRIMMLDAISCFGALPIHMIDDNIDVLLSCPHNCLESVPGFSFVIVKRELLEAAKGECHSLVLDLYEQWSPLETTGQFRFTPPTHALVAFQQALREIQAEGGVEGRSQRYRKTADAFVTRIRALGFSMLLSEADTGPVVQCILCPKDLRFDITTFSQKLRDNGFAIAPGALSRRNSFRISTSGKIDEKLVAQLIATIETVMNDMGVRDFSSSEG